MMQGRGWKFVGSRRSTRGGASAIEFAIVFPIFLLLVLGVIEFGRLMWHQSALGYAVERAARCASVNQTLCGAPAQVQAYAAAHAPGITIPADAVALTTASCGVQVTASSPFSFAVSTLFPWTITLTARACVPASS